MESHSTVLKVRVSGTGDLTVDGVPASLEELSTTLARMRAENGVVWYYREDAAAASHPLAERIIGLVIKNGLPISLSTKPDFSDYVDANGQAHPRKERI